MRLLFICYYHKITEIVDLRREKKIVHNFEDVSPRSQSPALGPVVRKSMAAKHVTEAAHLLSAENEREQEGVRCPGFNSRVCS